MGNPLAGLRPRPVMGVFLMVATLTMGGTAWVVTSGASTPRASSHHGDTLTVLEGGSNLVWAAGLDPSTNTDANADQTIENAVFGELFELGPGGKTIPDLASGYHLGRDGKTLIIDIRKGVTFTDGTPFDAAAVAYNLRKDLASSSSDKPNWIGASITTPSRYTVVVYLKSSDGAIINQFQDSIVNWIASPTAMRKESATAFGLDPIGAGPFIVQSNTPDSKIVLRRNPHYWEKGHPYLNHLIFEVTANDESALEDLQAGTGQAYEFMQTPNLVPAFRRAGLTVTAEPSTAPNAVQVNTLEPPFDNILAREAVYYATNAQALDKVLNNDIFPVTESFTSPTGLFYEPKVPGYRTYDLSKAKALVKELGSLSFTVVFLPVTSGGTQLAEALQAMWEQAGMHVTLDSVSLPALIQDYAGQKWNVSLISAGSFDPAASFGLSFRYAGRLSGVDDPHLDALLAAGEASVSNLARSRIYAKIAEYISKEAYSPFLYPGATWNIAAKGVQGPGLTTALPESALTPEILWEDVSVGNG